MTTKLSKVKKSSGPVCFFCLKSYFNDINGEKDSSSGQFKNIKLLRRFLTLFQRYTGTRVDMTSALESVTDDESLEISACSVCFTQTSAFCDIYFKMKCLELEAQWKAQILLEVMCQASKVPRRAQSIRQRLHKNGGKSCFGARSNYYESFTKLRNDMIQAGNQTISKSFPRVELSTDISPEIFTKREETSVEVNQKPPVDIPITLQDCKDLTQPWILTFSAVLFLLSLSPPLGRLQNYGETGTMNSEAGNRRLSLEDSERDDINETEECMLRLGTDINQGLKCEEESVETSCIPLSTENALKQSTAKLIRTPFKCKLCKKCYSSYQSLLIHTKTFAHSRKRRHQKQANTETHPPSEINRQSNPVKPSIPDSPTTSYNLRRRDKSVSMFPVDSSSSGDDDEEFIREYSSSSSSSSSVASGDEKILALATDKKPWRRYRISNATSGEDDENGTRAKKFRCNLCPKKFSRKLYLDKHRLFFHSKTAASVGVPVKSEINTFVCPTLKCTKSYRRMEHLERHRALHGNFKCQFCEASEEYAPDLSLHELEHSILAGDYGESTIFKCPRCSHISRSKCSYVSHHLEQHLNLTDRFFACSICRRKFRTGADKNKHFKRSHQTKGVDTKEYNRCDKCSAYFLSERQLRYHLMACETGDKSLKILPSVPRVKISCDFPNCKQSFEFPEELQDHKKLHGEFKCSVCDFNAEYAADLPIHETEHANVRKQNESRKRFLCGRCSYNSVVKNQLVRHFLEQHLGLNSRIYFCSICKARFLTNNAKMRHANVSHKIDGMEPSSIQRCDQCPAYFTQKLFLLQHKRKIHEGLDNRSFKCVYCKNKDFLSRDALLLHRRRVHGIDRSSKYIEFQFTCHSTNCGKSFETKDALIWHQRYGHTLKDIKSRKKVVTKVEVTKCDTCGKECKGLKALKCHMHVHRRERPTEFKCDKCDKTFRVKYQLERHQEYHKAPEEWKFMCSICSKKCVLKCTLDQHMNTHTKAKSFVCQVCGAKYAHRHNLRNHVNSKHKADGVQDVPKKFNRKYFVSRKGKKLKDGFCLTRDMDSANNRE